MLSKFIKKYSWKDPMSERINIYFHNFRNQNQIKSFDVFSSSSKTVKDIFEVVRSVLKINKNTPMQAYEIKNVDKLKYCWLYDINKNGYGPKDNFKQLSDNSDVLKCENILVNYHHSQSNEDYIIQKIFDKIGASNRYFVEFGAGDGEMISNTILLRYDGWKGLLIDSGEGYGKDFGPEISNAVCIKEFLTPDNIESVFKKAGVAETFDFLSVDIDGNDYYLWEAIKYYKPRVVCIEVDSTYKDFRKLEPYEKTVNGQKCSIITMTELAERKGYKLIYNNGGNIFYVNNSDYVNFFKEQKLVKWNEPFTATADLF